MESGDKRVDGILVVRVVELVAGDPLDFVAKVAVLLRVGHSGRHRHQRLLSHIKCRLERVGCCQNNFQ